MPSYTAPVKAPAERGGKESVGMLVDGAERGGLRRPVQLHVVVQEQDDRLVESRQHVVERRETAVRLRQIRAPRATVRRTSSEPSVEPLSTTLTAHGDGACAAASMIEGRHSPSRARPL